MDHFVVNIPTLILLVSFWIRVERRLTRLECKVFGFGNVNDYEKGVKNVSEKVD